MKKIPSKRTGKDHQSGQSLVELAISLTAILLLLAGAVDFGLAFYSYVALQDAAQEGALYGSFSPYIDVSGDGKYTPGVDTVNVAGIRNRIRASSSIPLNFSNATLFPDSSIDAVATTGMACEGTDVTTGTTNGIRVTISYNYPIIMPFLGAIIGRQYIPLHATVTDTILEPRCP